MRVQCFLVVWFFVKKLERNKKQYIIVLLLVLMLLLFVDIMFAHLIFFFRCVSYSSDRIRLKLIKRCITYVNPMFNYCTNMKSISIALLVTGWDFLFFFSLVIAREISQLNWSLDIFVFFFFVCCFSFLSISISHFAFSIFS